MLRPLTLALLLAAGAASASPNFDPRAVPGGFGGSQPIHVDGTDGDGVPIIHRPEPNAAGSASSGVGAIMGAADDNTVSYSGPAYGSLGFSTAPRVTGNDGAGGAPIVSRR